jgi:hypothetical protein
VHVRWTAATQTCNNYSRGKENKEPDTFNKTSQKSSQRRLHSITKGFFASLVEGGETQTTKQRRTQTATAMTKKKRKQ